MFIFSFYDFTNLIYFIHVWKIAVFVRTYNLFVTPKLPLLLLLKLRWRNVKALHRKHVKFSIFKCVFQNTIHLIFLRINGMLFNLQMKQKLICYPKMFHIRNADFSTRTSIINSFLTWKVLSKKVKKGLTYLKKQESKTFSKSKEMES